MQRRQHNSFATLAVFPLSASLVGKFKPTSFKSCQLTMYPFQNYRALLYAAQPTRSMSFHGAPIPRSHD